MNKGIELFHQDGKSSGVWYCGECRAVSTSKESADACHGERLCDCGKPTTTRYNGKCADCDSKAWRERMDREELAQYEAATKIPEAEWTGDQVFWGNRYFETVDEAVEHAESGGMPTPEYIWAANNIGVKKADIEDLVTRIVEDMWEDADVADLNGVAELQSAVDAFNETNKGVIVWMVDYSKAIIIEGADAD